MPTAPYPLPNARPKPDGSPAEVRRQRLPGQAFALTSVDTLDWSHPELPWRLRFRASVPTDTLFGVRAQQDARIIEQMMRHCQGRARAATAGLYLAETRDAARLLELYPDFITRLQHKSQYDAAREIARQLAESLTEPAHAD